MSFTGSCHCGALSYVCDADPTGGMTCTCSICRRKGSILHFVDADQVRLSAEPEALGTYHFNKHIIAHHFCILCGIAPWSSAKMPDGTAKVALNLRTADVPFTDLPLTEFDGAAS